MLNRSAIKLHGVTKRFDKFKLGPLDMTVPKGSIYGYVGPNGAGKTTTIDLIMGMGRNDAGSIEVFGLDHIDDEVAIKSRVGYVSPELNLVPWKRVGRVVNFFRSFYPDWDDDYCTELIDRLGLDWNDKIATLSYGSKTKLGVVLALSHRPDLLLLDEPLAGLDAVAKREVFAELLDAVQDETRTVLISSHNLDDIERFTDHLGIIKNGKLMLEGPTANLIERFQMADCSQNGARPTNIQGIYAATHIGDRWRFLVDTSTNALDTLRNRGISDITTAPVTLEELFVALVKEG